VARAGAGVARAPARGVGVGGLTPTIKYELQGGGAAHVPAHHLRLQGGLAHTPAQLRAAGRAAHVPAKQKRPAGQPLALGGRVGQEQE
jgi:hypothetical protein